MLALAWPVIVELLGCCVLKLLFTMSFGLNDCLFTFYGYYVINDSLNLFISFKAFGGSGKTL